MTSTTPEQAVLNAARWQEWIEKGKRHDQATARKVKMVIVIVLALAAVGISIYLFSMK